WLVLLPLKLIIALPALLILSLLSVLVPGMVHGAMRGTRVGGRGAGWIIGRPMGWLAGGVQNLYGRVATGYARILPRALQRPGLVLGGAALMFALALLLVPRLGMDLVPQLAQDRFEMTLKLAPGTQLRDTDALVRQVQRAHEGDADIQALYGVSGS